MATTSMKIEGTHCESCKVLLEEVGREIPGVKHCTVDFRTGRTVIEHDGPLDWPRLQREIEALGPYRPVRPA